MNKMTQLLKFGTCLGLVGVLSLGSFAANQSQDVNAAERERTTLLMASKEDKEVEEEKEEKKEASEEEEEKEEKKEASEEEEEMSIPDLVEKSMPSVVSISTKSIQEVQDYFSLFDFYGGYAPSTQEYEVEGGGSGIIIGRNDTELLVVTNNHVVEGATELAICFIDNNAYKGIVKSGDATADVAVVAVKLDDIDEDTLDKISVAKIGSSDDLRVGEQVVLIGNAMGYGQSVTTGIVSAKNRKIDANGNLTDQGVNLIQTDAAINPGNSGGAMLNMKGEVVGINSSKLSSTTIEGMCYAISISDVDDMLEDMMNLETREKVEGSHGALGISVYDVSNEAHSVYGLPLGAYVVEVNEDEAADKAGIKEGSIITKLGGRNINSTADLITQLEFYAPDEEVEVTVSEQTDKGYEEKTYTVVLQESASSKQDTDKEEDKNNNKEPGINFGDSEEGDDDFFFRGWGEEDKKDEDRENAFGQGTFGNWD